MIFMQSEKKHMPFSIGNY